MNVPRSKRVSPFTVTRLSQYLRCLEELRAGGAATVSSSRLAELISLNPAQIRKDLSVFGGFGRKGKGYEVEGLIGEIAAILGVDRQWPALLAGVGNLGGALLKDRGFETRGFPIVTAFDVDPVRVGAVIGGVLVRRPEEMPDMIRSLAIRIALIATPAEAAQGVLDQALLCGIRAFLNFTHCRLLTPPDVMVRNVDFTGELEFLTFHLQREGRS